MQEALKNGVIAGYPIEDVRVELIFGSYHDVDSSKWHSKLQVRWQFRRPVKRLPKINGADYEGRSYCSR